MDTSVKKKVLQLFPSPVFVVGCKKGEKIHAFCGSWISQVSFEPPLVFVGVKKGSTPAEMMQVGNCFTISILEEGSVDEARVFIKSPEPSEGKFGSVPFTFSPNGSPVLTKALGWIECRCVNQWEPGDHILFVGEVIDCHLAKEGVPLATINCNLKYGG